MIKKQDKLIITFHTTTDAMEMEEICKKIHADGRLIPVPRMISAGCGLAWCAEPESEKEIKEIIRQYGIRYQDIHRCMV